jgi:hypothetical protein
MREKKNLLVCVLHALIAPVCISRYAAAPRLGRGAARIKSSPKREACGKGKKKEEGAVCGGKRVVGEREGQ